MEGVSGFTRSIIDEFESSDIQQDQTQGKGGVSPSIIDEIYS